METLSPTEALQATVRQRDQVAVIDLAGELNRPAERALNAAYAEAAGYDPAGILLNFRDVGYINSTGIALIVALLAKARADRRPVMVCGLSDHYRQIFEITRLADFMQLYPDEASAVAGAGPVLSPERAS